ncbi:MAG: hypothetical protein FJ005_09155 [Chloroflexi bacterium]|nr:hypothetical protein [Chloroflexota bacterium]
MVRGLLASLFVFLICFLGCANGDEQLKQQFMGACSDYVADVANAHQTFIERANSDADLLRDGKISTKEFRERHYIMLFSHARILEFLDQRPEYKALLNVLLEKEAPSALAPLPILGPDPEKTQSEYESYLEDYIEYHLDVVGKIEDYLKSGE